MEKRILVFGKSGQLGQEIVEAFSKDSNWKVIAPDEKEADIVHSNLNAIASNCSPTVIVNCAAYTNVDECERNTALAQEVNSRGAARAAEAALRTKSFFIHVSTDYVYDGSIDKPLTHKTCSNLEKPLNKYGMTKLLGETFISDKFQAIDPHRYLILRTSGLYGKYGNHFLKKMLKRMEETFPYADGRYFDLIADQKYCPTSALQLARQIKTFAEMSEEDREYLINREGNVLNACSTSSTSPFLFLTHYLSAMKLYDYFLMMYPKRFEDFFKENEEAAKRPQYAVLENEMEKYGKELNAFTSVEEAIEKYVEESQK